MGKGIKCEVVYVPVKYLKLTFKIVSQAENVM